MTYDVCHDVCHYVTLYNIADTNRHEAKKKTLALQGFFVEVAGFEPAAFWSRTILSPPTCFLSIR